MRLYLYACVLISLVLPAQAWAFFSDDDARRSINHMVERTEQLQTQVEHMAQAQKNQLAQFERLEALGQELAELRGEIDVLAHTLAQIKDSQYKTYEHIDSRLRAIEPQKKMIAGKEALITRPEQADFDEAIAAIQASNFKGGLTLLEGFSLRYPSSAYMPDVLFWRGNAQYTLGHYTQTISSLRDLLKRYPDYLRIPDAMLTLASAHVEKSSLKKARGILDDITKRYPNSKAAKQAQERLSALDALKNKSK